MEEFQTFSGRKLQIKSGPKLNTFWMKQNPDKSSEWALLAKQSHEIFHLMIKDSEGRLSGYEGLIEVDGKAYTYKEARLKFFNRL